MTTIAMPPDVAVADVGQGAEVVMTQVTIVLLVNVFEVNDGLLVPVFTPFTFH